VRQQALFSALRGSDFDHLLTLIRSAVVPAATQLYAQDESAKAIYTVRWGLVKLAKHTPEGGARIVRLLGPGAAVGLEAVEEGVYWHTAIALRETSLCRIPLKVVERLQGHNQQVAERLISQWERYVEYADRWITELSGGPVMPRVRRLMALLVEISGSAAGEVEVPSVEDLASILGASVESVSRAMAELKRGEVLTRVAPRTYRCDLDALNA
jgi:CRP-like cAMP-binding protein